MVISNIRPAYFYGLPWRCAAYGALEDDDDDALSGAFGKSQNFIAVRLFH